MDHSAAAVLTDDAPVTPESAPSQVPKRWLRKLGSLAIGLTSIAAWLLLWEAASIHEWSFFFRFENIPAPSEVLLALAELFQAPKFAGHVLNSIRRVFLGFGVAATLAVVLGLLIGRFRLAEQSLLPPLEILR